MSKHILVPQLLLPLSAVRLGRLIASVKEPLQGFHDPPYEEQPESHTTVQGSFVSGSQKSRSKSFGSALTALLSVGFSRAARVEIQVTADAVTTHPLGNSDDWFERATKSEGTRLWMERQVDRGYSMYMIVGFTTVTNATFAQVSSHEKEVGADVHAPVNLTLAAVGAAVPLVGEILDSSVGAQSGRSDSQAKSFVVSGEYVCALQYRKVKHRWLSSNVDKLRLSRSTQWHPINLQDRKQTGEDDVMDVGVGDLREEELEGSWTKSETGDGSVLFLAD